MYIGLSIYLNALNPNGSVKWSFYTSNGIYSSPAIASDGTVYIGALNDKLYALYPTNGSMKWSYTRGGYIQGSPAIASDCTVYIRV